MIHENHNTVERISEPLGPFILIIPLTYISGSPNYLFLSRNKDWYHFYFYMADYIM